MTQRNLLNSMDNCETGRSRFTNTSWSCSSLIFRDIYSVISLFPRQMEFSLSGTAALSRCHKVLSSHLHLHFSFISLTHFSTHTQELTQAFTNLYTRTILHYSISTVSILSRCSSLSSWTLTPLIVVVFGACFHSAYQFICSGSSRSFTNFTLPSCLSISSSSSSSSSLPSILFAISSPLNSFVASNTCKLCTPKAPLVPQAFSFYHLPVSAHPLLQRYRYVHYWSRVCSFLFTFFFVYAFYELNFPPPFPLSTSQT